MKRLSTTFRVEELRQRTLIRAMQSGARWLIFLGVLTAPRLGLCNGRSLAAGLQATFAVMGFGLLVVFVTVLYWLARRRDQQPMRGRSRLFSGAVLFLNIVAIWLFVDMFGDTATGADGVGGLITSITLFATGVILSAVNLAKASILQP